MNGLRGLAALAILTRHLQPTLLTGQPMPSSYLAVDLFFLLSGFVLSYAYGERLSRGMTPLDFMRRRVERLYPLYLLASIIAIAAAGRRCLSLNQLVLFVANAVYIPIPVGDLFHVYPLNFPAWSLGLELLVNLVLVVAFSRLTQTTLAILIFASAVALLVTSLHFGGINVGMHWKDAWGGFPRVFFSFFTGIAVERSRSKTSPNLPQATSYVLLIAMLISLWIDAGSYQGVYDVLVVTIAFPMIVFTAARCEEPTGFGARIMMISGLASYAIYVLQAPIVQIASLVVTRLGWRATPLLAFGFVAAFFVVCIVIDAVYDSPVRRTLAARHGT